MKCGITYKKIAIRAGDDERLINHEWPNQEQDVGSEAKT